jgi:uncharacterized protein YggE
MRRLGILLGAILAALVTAVLVHGQPDRPRPETAGTVRTITAYGTGTASAAPDAARVYLEVTSNAKTVPAARAENARAAKAVREALAGLKVEGLRTRISGSDVHPTRNKDGELTGYSVSVTFAVFIPDREPERLAANAERVLEAGLQSGANADGGVYFFRSDDAELRREAMRKAVEDAVASTRALAAGAKVTVAEVVTIEEIYRWGEDGDLGPRGGGGNPLLGGGEPAQTTFAAGAWEVSRRVRVVCRY